ncbi:MAG TPA: GIY-YIG nuclease family protein [Roseomonas sp.]|jgi:hypothetical protein
MDGAARKAAVAAYRERKVASGIYAVRCRPTGQCWVGRAPDLGTIGNRIWFTLRHGAFPYRSLQAAWNTHPAEAFTLEELERLDADALAYGADRALKARQAHWCAALGAEPV